MASPIKTWDGAAEYFTFAHSPTLLYGILIAAAALVVFAIIFDAAHEIGAYKKITKPE